MNFYITEIYQIIHLRPENVTESFSEKKILKNFNSFFLKKFSPKIYFENFLLEIFFPKFVFKNFFQKQIFGKGFPNFFTKDKNFSKSFSKKNLQIFLKFLIPFLPKNYIAIKHKNKIIILFPSQSHSIHANERNLSA